MKFIRDWQRCITEAGKFVYRPILGVLIKDRRGILDQYDFIVDTGADISLAPRYLAERIGLDWRSGVKVNLKGISERKVCWVEGRIHPVEIIVPEVKQKIEIPICFARGKAPMLLGREGLFDYFNIEFQKERGKIIFMFP